MKIMCNSWGMLPEFHGCFLDEKRQDTSGLGHPWRHYLLQDFGAFGVFAQDRTYPSDTYFLCAISLVLVLLTEFFISQGL